MCDANKSVLSDFLLEKTKGVWEEKKEPYLLSSVGVDLKKEKGKNIKEELNGEKLKSWIINNKDSILVEVIEHPLIKEKIGIIPKGEVFNYTSESERKINKKNNISVKSRLCNKKENENLMKLKDFLNMVSVLSEKDLDKVIIPSSVILKIMGGK